MWDDKHVLIYLSDTFWCLDPFLIGRQYPLRQPDVLAQESESPVAVLTGIWADKEVRLGIAAEEGFHAQRMVIMCVRQDSAVNFGDIYSEFRCIVKEQPGPSRIKQVSPAVELNVEGEAPFPFEVSAPDVVRQYSYLHTLKAAEGLSVLQI